MKPPRIYDVCWCGHYWYDHRDLDDLSCSKCDCLIFFHCYEASWLSGPPERILPISFDALRLFVMLLTV